MDQNPEGGLSASVTYAELKAHFDQNQGAELGPQQRSNRLSGLKKYQDSLGRADADPIGPELNGQFEQRRAAFLPRRVLPGGAIRLPGETCTHSRPAPFTAHVEQTLKKRHTPPSPAGSYFLCTLSRSPQWN